MALVDSEAKFVEEIEAELDTEGLAMALWEGSSVSLLNAFVIEALHDNEDVTVFRPLAVMEISDVDDGDVDWNED